MHTITNHAVCHTIMLTVRYLAARHIVEVRATILEIAQDFMCATVGSAEGLASDTPFMDLGLDSLDMLKLAR